MNWEVCACYWSYIVVNTFCFVMIGLHFARQCGDIFQEWWTNLKSFLSSDFGILCTNKKLSYRRGAARCVVSTEILPIATQQCHKQTDDVELCISPVYRRLAVAKFSKSTMYNLLTWPWPCPLREHSLITRLRLHMADPCTKSEVSSVSRCGYITWGVKF